MGLEEGANLVRLLLCNTFFGDIFCEQFVWRELACEVWRGNNSSPANLRPLSIEAWFVSTKVTGTPALCAATRAIPRPYETVST